LVIEDREGLSRSVREAVRARLPARPVEGISTGGMVLNEGYGRHDGNLFIARGLGVHVFDTEGNRYVDFALGAGTHILGHVPDPVVDAAIRQLNDGTLFVRPNLDAHRYAELLSSLQPSPKRFAFCNSGAEATMRAMRAARGFTGRDKIAVWPGSWHGSHDWGLFEEQLSSAANLPTVYPRSAGVPADLARHLLMLPPAPEAAVEFVERHADELAMVFIEPVRGPLPEPNSGELVRALREATRRCGLLLGFDEVVTGFRLALGGGQEYFGVEADIVAYGKIVGGGLPAGAVGMTEPIADVISANAARPTRIVYFGGTFSANPLCMATGLATVRKLANEAGNLYPRLDTLVRDFVTTANQCFARENIAMRVAGEPGIFRYLFTDRPLNSRRERDAFEAPRAVQDLFYDMLLLDGMHVGTNRIMFLSALHDESHMSDLLQASLVASRRLRDAGMLGHL
jgi:glutamate-1-semialdehyde 2,1-aminomutase